MKTILCLKVLAFASLCAMAASSASCGDGGKWPRLQWSWLQRPRLQWYWLQRSSASTASASTVLASTASASMVLVSTASALMGLALMAPGPLRRFNSPSLREAPSCSGRPHRGTTGRPQWTPCTIDPGGGHESKRHLPICDGWFLLSAVRSSVRRAADHARISRITQQRRTGRNIRSAATGSNTSSAARFPPAQASTPRMTARPIASTALSDSHRNGHMPRSTMPASAGSAPAYLDSSTRSANTC